MTTLKEIQNLGYLSTDTICVFCSAVFCETPNYCGKCLEYKGIMKIIDAVEYYGINILPV